jgi:hypothetical protein
VSDAPPAARAESRKPRKRTKPEPEEAARRDEIVERDEGGGAETQARPVETSEEVAEEVPAFARGWPRDVDLTALVTAFEAGNYARVRRDAPELARRAADPEVRRAAKELVQRIEPDPVAGYMLAVTAVLLVILAGWYWSHPHH